MMTMIVLIVVLLGAGWAAAQVMKFLRRRRMEQALRQNPPKLAQLMVRLPVEATSTNQSMTRFFDRLERLLPNDDKAVQQNTNVVHFTYLGKGREVGQSPLVSYILECPPELVDRVEVTLTECYGSDAQILLLKEKDNPFLAYIAATQARQAWEAEQQAQRAASDDADDDRDED